MENQIIKKFDPPVEKHVQDDMSVANAFGNNMNLNEIHQYFKGNEVLGCSPTMKNLPDVEFVKHVSPQDKVKTDRVYSTASLFEPLNNNKDLRIKNDGAHVVTDSAWLDPHTPYNVRVMTDGVNKGARTEITYPKGVSVAVPGSMETVELSKVQVDSRTPEGRLGGSRVTLVTQDGEKRSFSYPNISGAAQAAWTKALIDLA